MSESRHLQQIPLTDIEAAALVPIKECARGDRVWRHTNEPGVDRSDDWESIDILEPILKAQTHAYVDRHFLRISGSISRRLAPGHGFYAIMYVVEIIEGSPAIGDDSKPSLLLHVDSATIIEQPSYVSPSFYAVIMTFKKDDGQLNLERPAG